MLSRTSVSYLKDFVDRSKLAFGIESEVDYTDDSLHFFVDPDIIRQGAAWIFPIGQKSRIGVTSYAGKTQILPKLSGFIRTLGHELSGTHGGYIPFGLREPVVDYLFMAGDSAGMAPPTTSE
jgi:flavin-dependent dehydrogenase